MAVKAVAYATSGNIGREVAVWMVEEMGASWMDGDRFEGDRYEFELDGLEDLCRFVEKVGHCVIFKEEGDDRIELEIYDFWRE